MRVRGRSKGRSQVCQRRGAPPAAEGGAGQTGDSGDTEGGPALQPRRPGGGGGVRRAHSVDRAKVGGPRINLNPTQQLHFSRQELDLTEMPLRLELQHGSHKQLVSLPTDTLDKSKKYFVTFTINKTETAKQQQHDGVNDLNMIGTGLSKPPPMQEQQHLPQQPV